MALKTMLTVHDSSMAPDRLAPIVEFARAYDAHLNVVVLGLVVPIPATVYGLGVDVAWVERPEDVRADVEACSEKIEKMLATAGVSATVIAEFPEVGVIDRTVQKHALFADLTVLPSGEILKDATANDVFEGAMHDTGRAALVLGKAGPGVLPAQRVVVAWDGGSQSAKAVRECLPFLAPKASVRVVTVDPKIDRMGPNPGNDIATYLARHDCQVEVERCPSEGRRPGDIILENVRDTDAQLIVMGTFAHPRVRQWLMGGATQDILSKTEVAVLGAH